MTKKSDENRQTCSQKALVYLREQIINGNLLPQEKLVESELAGILGISRGPVRDALKQLAIEGLVDYQPNRGCTVALLSPRDAYEVFFLRGSLEKLALQRSGCHIGSHGIFLMEAALEEIRALAGTGNRPHRSAIRRSSGRRAMSPSSVIISMSAAAGCRPASRARSTAASVWPLRRSTPWSWA